MSSPKGSALPKRTIAPLFWLLFGAGGMLSALFGPALILITGIMIPHGLGVPERFGSYAGVLAFARNPVGKPPSGCFSPCMTCGSPQCRCCAGSPTV
jgi:fumarate reductase subunit D